MKSQLYEKNTLSTKDVIDIIGEDKLIDEIGKDRFLKYFGVEELEE